MTTTRKKKTTKPKVKKEEVVVEEVQEPELPPVFKQFMVKVYKTAATRDRITNIGYIGFSEKEQTVVFGCAPAFQNEVKDVVNRSYHIDGVMFASLTRDWWDNLSKSSIIPSSWTMDLDNQVVLDEI